MIDELGKDIAAMTASAINGFANLLLFSTEFFNSIEDGMGSIRNLIDATKEIAFVGKAAFGGLAPIVDAFSAFVEGAANIINNLDDSFVSAAVTATVLLIAFDKVSGILGTLISLFPALSVSLRRADGSLLALVRSFGSFLKQHPVLFAGFTSLSEATENLGDEHALLTSKLLVSQGALDGINDEFKGHIKDAVMAAQSMDEFEDELTSVAIQLDMTDQQLENVNRELANTAIRSRLAKDGLDDLKGLDPNTVLRRRQQVGIEGGAQQTRIPFLIGPPTGGKRARETLRKTSNSAAQLKNEISITGTAIKDFFKGGFVKRFNRVTGLLATQASKLGIVGTLYTAVGSALTSLGAAAAGAAGFVAPLAAFLLLLGGVAVGIIGNLDKIKASLAEFGELGGEVLRDLGSYLLNTFIRVWNALTPAIDGVLMAVRPLMELFAGGAGGGMAGGFLATLIDIGKFLVDIFIIVVDSVAKTIKLIGMLVGVLLPFLSMAGSVIFAPFFILFEVLQQIAKLVGDVFSHIENAIKTNEALKPLIDRLTSIGNVINIVFDAIIGGLNAIIPLINLIPGVEFQEMSLSKDVGRFDVTKEDVIDGGREGAPEIEGKTPAQFSYEEYNNTTNNTNVDAQPEDTATISRVVEDAIREANSFGRRTAGGQ
jgi:hypothetical protein